MVKKSEEEGDETSVLNGDCPHGFMYINVVFMMNSFSEMQEEAEEVLILPKPWLRSRAYGGAMSMSYRWVQLFCFYLVILSFFQWLLGHM